MNDDFAALLMFFAVSVTVNVALGVAWFRAGRRYKRLESKPVRHEVMDDGRMERLESIVEGLATQVDQLASSQEFVNRLITSKQPGKLWSAGSEKGVVTPH